MDTTLLPEMIFVEPALTKCDIGVLFPYVIPSVRQSAHNCNNPSVNVCTNDYSTISAPTVFRFHTEHVVTRVFKISKIVALSIIPKMADVTKIAKKYKSDIFSRTTWYICINLQKKNIYSRIKSQ